MVVLSCLAYGPQRLGRTTRRSITRVPGSMMIHTSRLRNHWWQTAAATGRSNSRNLGQNFTSSTGRQPAASGGRVKYIPYLSHLLTSHGRQAFPGMLHESCYRFIADESLPRGSTAPLLNSVGAIHESSAWSECPEFVCNR